jgi:hypothetical protein
MPIDRIGKSGTVPGTLGQAPSGSAAPAPTQGAPRFVSTATTVSTVTTAAEAAPRAAGASAPGPAVGALEQLRSGAITLDGYLDLKVSEATAHLVTLPPAQLHVVRAALRDRLASDPTLVELVRTVAAAAPPAPGAQAPRDD